MSVLRDDFLRFTSEHALFSCKSLIVGVSGGPDSMCLLALCASLRDAIMNGNGGSEKKRDNAVFFPDVYAVHVNHHIRAQSDDDETLVRMFCAARNIPLLVKSYDVPAVSRENRRGLEETGRDLRLRAFNEISSELSEHGRGPVYIALAHHREDSAETVLMNLFRGSGTEGLTGIKPRNKNLVRPLLFTDKPTIMAYLQEEKIAYAEDVTNRDSTMTRNFWRNEIFPRIGEMYGKDPTVPVILTAGLLESDESYFREIVDSIFDSRAVILPDGSPCLPCSVLRNSHAAIASRLIRRLFLATYGNMTDFSETHLAAVRRLCQEVCGEKRISLPGNRYAAVIRNYLFFEKDSDDKAVREGGVFLPEGVVLCGKEWEETEFAFPADPTSSPLDIPGTDFILETILVENPDQVVYNSRTWYCDKDLVLGATFRTVRPYDTIRRAGSTGRKPLRRFFTDRKIPRSVRSRVLFLARGSEVLWIPGLSLTEGFFDSYPGDKPPVKKRREDSILTDSTCRILRITLIKKGTNT